MTDADFRRLYLQRKGWQHNPLGQWNLPGVIDYWTSLEDALDIQMERDQQEEGSSQP